jgi:hypothetical protein
VEPLLATHFHTGFLLGLFFDPEDGGDMFLQNVSRLSTDYAALYPRRQNSSWLDTVFVICCPMGLLILQQVKTHRGKAGTRSVSLPLDQPNNMRQALSYSLHTSAIHYLTHHIIQ